MKILVNNKINYLLFRNFLLVVIFLKTGYFSLYSVPAPDILTTIKQPDNTEIRVFVRGDERIN
jgi:hypothetical protein